MNDNNKKKSFNRRVLNTLETLKDVGGDVTKNINKASSDTVKTLNRDLLSKMPGDFMDQLFGPPAKLSAEITAGQSIEIKDFAKENKAKTAKLEKRLSYERRMRYEDSIFIQKRSNELRLQLQAVMQEVVALTRETQDLAEETKIAAMQAPVEPGSYHIIFFTNLLSFLKSFRKKIESASVWLHSANSRAQKKNWVSNYKKHGAKYLLSGEHYLSRSAG